MGEGQEIFLYRPPIKVEIGWPLESDDLGPREREHHDSAEWTPIEAW